MACVARLAPAVILVLGFAATGAAQSPPLEKTTTDDAVLVVGTKEARPFAFKDEDGAWQGLAIELIGRIGDRLGLEIQFVPRKLDDMLDGVSTGELDAAIAAITVTPDRESRMDFSHPYADAALGIAVRAGAKRGWLAGLGRLWSGELWAVFPCLAFLLVLVGFLVWIAERRVNPEQFGGPPARGIGHGFWWAAVTMTTVGYGDKAPVGAVGRVIGLIWMFASLVIISGFTAAIASALTIGEMTAQVANADDLVRVRVGTVEGTTASIWLEDQGIRATGFATIDQALDALDDDLLDAVVHDAPILRFYVHNRRNGVMRVLPDRLAHGFYAIALPTGSRFTEPINRELLRLIESAEVRDLERRYFGGE